MPRAVQRSAGLLLAPFGDGCVVFDPVRDRTHLLGPLAAWIISSDEPTTDAELVDMLCDLAQFDRAEAESTLSSALGELTRLGLLGRTGRPERPAPVEPLLSEPQPGWHVSGVHALADRKLAFCGPDPELIGAIDTFLGDPGGSRQPDLHFGVVEAADGSIDLQAMEQWHFTNRTELLARLPQVLADAVRRTEAMPVLRAGAVRSPDGAVVLIVGSAGAGVSTLIAGAIGAGCDLIGDGSIGIDPDASSLWAHPLPLDLDPTAQAVLGLDRVADDLPDRYRRAVDIRADARSLTGTVGPPDLIIQVAYRPGEPVQVGQLDSAETLELLLPRTTNLARVGNPGLAAVATVSATTPALFITHGDSRVLARTITEHAGRVDDLLTAVRHRADQVADRLAALPTWWTHWELFHPRPVDGLVRDARQGVILLHAPGRPTVEIDPVRDRVCADPTGSTSLGAMFAALGSDRGPQDAIDLVVATRWLQEAGYLHFDESPRQGPWEVTGPDPPPRRFLPQPPPRTGSESEPVHTTRPRPLPRRPGERPAGVFTVAGPGGVRRFAISTDVDELRTWLTTLSVELFDPGEPFTAAPPVPIRILSTPGDTAWFVAVLPDGTLAGPVPVDQIVSTLTTLIATTLHPEPPAARIHTPGWVTAGVEVTADALGPVQAPPDARWVPRIWFGTDGHTVWRPDTEAIRDAFDQHRSDILRLQPEQVWVVRPLDRLHLAGTATGRAAGVALTVDAFRAAGGAGEDPAGLFDVAWTIVDDGRLTTAAPRQTGAEPVADQGPVAAFAHHGRFTEAGRSVKVSSAGLVIDRPMWEWRIAPEAPDSERNALTGVIAAFATGTHAARELMDLDAHSGAFVLATETGPAGRRRNKLYVDLIETASWEGLRETFAALGDLHDASVLTTGTPTGVPPRYVAWKHTPTDDSTVLSVYRRDHDPARTVDDALGIILAGHPDWLPAVRQLVAVFRPTGEKLRSEDLEVIEQGGRASIDLSIDDVRPGRGARVAPAYWLAVLAGSDATDAWRWARILDANRVFRLTVGTDPTGAPFVGAYLH